MPPTEPELTVVDVTDSSMRIGVLSTYPPTQCGLATYTRALVDGIAEVRGGIDGIGVVRVVDRIDDIPDDDPPEVVGAAIPGGPGWELAADVLSTFDVVSVQHEYGIYGPDDGEAVVDMLKRISAPVVTTLHTVQDGPTSHRLALLRQISELSDAVCVTSESARRRLLSDFGLDSSKVFVVPHGAHLFAPVTPPDDRPRILTWGLIRPGKGIEWMILGMKRLRDLQPPPLYVVAGVTHPHTVDAEGESYRRYLEGLVHRADLGDVVEFRDEYLDDAALARLVGEAKVVVIPYDTTDQVSSGVLIEAVGAAKPVVATDFPHAREMLASGAGMIVPHAEPAALADAVGRLLTDPAAYAEASAAARRLSTHLSWPQIGRRFLDVLETVRRRAVEDSAHLSVAEESSIHQP